MTEMITGVENADDPIAAGEADALDEQLVERARADCTALKRIPADGRAPVVHDALCHCVTLATSGEHEMPQNAIKSCGQTAVKRS